MTPKKAAQELYRLGSSQAHTLDGYDGSKDPASVLGAEMSKLLETAYYGKDTRASTHNAYLKLADLLARMKGAGK